MVQDSACPTVGVLALQGGFSEHLEILDALQLPIKTLLVRTPEQLALCTALILPGGESTTISLLAQKSGLLQPLRDLVTRARNGESGVSVWGTCAGMILLGEEVLGKKEGYEGLGGVGIRVVRNQWGRQTESFSHSLSIPVLSSPSTPFPAVFIRAPVVHTLIAPSKPSSTSAPTLEVLARVPRSILPTPSHAALATGGSELGPDADVVMLRQGGVVVSSFHPELTGDWRVHEWWVKEMILGDGGRGESA
ncbi:class I glutamine amidotransferase-like protein [Leucosporidium creatinivorum]|uniref:glutaminase n=1 Tax=Leucosporidium creatinivorum TaxID=106004 RepID=A0A1Y2D8K2_9BASI|nr:class I glutamine amidotransferase-like protein [Leucosporidium creatinivorum]